MRHTSLRFLLALTIGIVFSTASAQADAFTFSFTNTTGNVPGTVTGEILGLNNNSTGPAAQVLIQSYPGAFNPAPFSLPVDATLFPNQFQNLFTEVSGTITSARFDADTSFSPTPPDQYILNLGSTFGEFFNTTNKPTCCSVLLSTHGPISFAPVSTPVPEPASFVLALGGMAWMMRKRAAR